MHGGVRSQRDSVWLEYAFVFHAHKVDVNLRRATNALKEYTSITARKHIRIELAPITKQIVDIVF